MTQIPLGVGAYSRPYGKLPEIRMENRFFEQNPLSAEETALLSRPGTTPFLSVGAGPIRALFSQYGVFSGDLFIVSGEALYRHSGGQTTQIAGSVGGSMYPVLAAVAIPGWEALFVTDGLSLQYYDGDGGLKACAVPDDVPIADLAVLASHVICAQKQSRKFFWITPGETDIDPLHFSSMEAEPDEIVGLSAVGDQFWIFGQSSSEAWYATGDADQPFLRAQGRAFSQGILPGTLARVQESIMLVGQDRIAYRIAGSPDRISNHGVEEALRQWEETISIIARIDYEVTSERTVKFSGHASTAASVTFSWDFGDGSPAVAGATVTHKYAALGTYTATLTVTDASGNTGTEKRKIVVETLRVAPTAFGGTWSRTAAAAEKIALTWTDPNTYVAGLARKVYRGGTQIADLAAGVKTFDHTNAHATVPLAGEVDNSYEVAYYDVEGEAPRAATAVWSGPLSPTGVTMITDPSRAYTFLASWTGRGSSKGVTELSTDYLCPGTYSLKGTYAFTESEKAVRVGNSAIIAADVPELQPFSVRLRVKLVTFGTTDYSKNDDVSAEVEGDANEVDGYQTCP